MILVVDDNLEICSTFERYAKKYGYDLSTLSDPLEAIDFIKNNEIELVVLDVSMPHIDGFSLYEKISEFKSIEVIFLSARVEEEDRIRGLLLGANDYICKPFSLKEIFIKIDRILDVQKKTFGSYTFLHAKNTVIYKEEHVKLTNYCFNLLLLLASNPDVILSREMILQEVWGLEDVDYSRTVDSHIKMIRAKIVNNDIKTIYGGGYVFKEIT